MEPGAAFFAPTMGEGELLVSGWAGEKPGGGVAKRLADVMGKASGEFGFAPETRVAEFASRAALQFGVEELIPGVAAGVAEADPGEVEEFVGEDAGVLGWVRLVRGMEVDEAAADIGCADGLAAAVAEIGGPEDADGFTVRWR